MSYERFSGTIVYQYEYDSDLDEDLDIGSLEIISSFVGSFDDSGNESTLVMQA